MDRPGKSIDMTVITKIKTSLKEAIAQNGHAYFITCGGSSPLGIFEALAHSDIGWAHITISLVDDRLVAQDHLDSNQRLVRQKLMTAYAEEARFLPLRKELIEDGTLPTLFDVMLLGMGKDGHFASLFPDMIDQPDAFDPKAKPALITTTAKGSPKHPRITMNLSLILRSRNIILLVIGEEKNTVLEQAMHDTSLPVHHLLKANPKNFYIER